LIFSSLKDDWILKQLEPLAGHLGFTIEVSFLKRRKVPCIDKINSFCSLINYFLNQTHKYIPSR